MHRTFEEGLDKLRSRIIRMGSLVEEQVEFAFRSLLTGNHELARIVLERDAKVDKLDIKIDKQCQKIFALNQPVASDLRLLLVALKMNNELERIGDMAFNIARITLADTNIPILAERLELKKMTEGVFTMVKNSMDAFVNSDPNLAYHILNTDEHINAMERAATDRLIGIMQSEPAIVRSGVEMIVVLRNLERMADQSTNIAENVIFLVEAKLIRNTHGAQQSESATSTDVWSDDDDKESA